MENVLFNWLGASTAFTWENPLPHRPPSHNSMALIPGRFVVLWSFPSFVSGMPLVIVPFSFRLDK